MLSEEPEKLQFYYDFMDEHKDFLPKYSPRGERIFWDVYIIKTGTHDPYTNKYTGGYKATVKQRPPIYISNDDRIYVYDIKRKELQPETILTGRWR